MQAALRQKTRDAWLAILNDADIPCAPINSFADVMAHPHTAASEMIAELDHARYGTVKTVRQPINFNGRRNEPVRPPPLMGEHTDEVLRELGYSDVEIEKLERDKVVVAGR